MGNSGWRSRVEGIATPQGVTWTPAAFVLLWSTGFIGGRWGLPHAGPFSLLAVRMIAATLLLGVMAWAARAVWPRDPRTLVPIVASGLLTHGTYLGGVFCAIAAGVSTGLVALIVGLQPLLTAVFGPLAGQRSPGRLQWTALVLGFIGLALVVSGKLGAESGDLAGWIPAVVALLGITAGSLIQKRWVTPMDFRVLASLQYGATAAVFVLLATAVEQWRLEWTLPLVGSLIWLTGALSVGAVALLYRLIRERSMEEVTSLFYLTPAVTAVMGFLAFGERLTLLQCLGFPIVGAAVWLTVRPKRN